MPRVQNMKLRLFKTCNHLLQLQFSSQLRVDTDATHRTYLPNPTVRRRLPGEPSGLGEGLITAP